MNGRNEVRNLAVVYINGVPVKFDDCITAITQTVGDAAPS
jgi:hypothetical protein